MKLHNSTFKTIWSCKSRIYSLKRMSVGPSSDVHIPIGYPSCYLIKLNQHFAKIIKGVLPSSFYNNMILPFVQVLNIEIFLSKVLLWFISLIEVKMTSLLPIRGSWNFEGASTKSFSSTYLPYCQWKAIVNISAFYHVISNKIQEAVFLFYKAEFVHYL